MDVRVPKFGMSTQEVDIVQVLVVPGQRVSAGEAIAEIEGEKSTLEIDADRSGTVTEVLVKVGDVRLVGDVILRIEEDRGPT